MKKIILAFSALFLYNCDNTENYKNITGEWTCSEWITESTGNDRCNNNVYFSFKDDKTYTSIIDTQKQSGIYKIANGLLYSTPKGKLEIGVEIKTLNKDTLQFIMSRFGEKEILTLLKKN